MRVGRGTLHSRYTALPPKRRPERVPALRGLPTGRARPSRDDDSSSGGVPVDPLVERLRGCPCACRLQRGFTAEPVSIPVPQAFCAVGRMGAPGSCRAARSGGCAGVTTSELCEWRPSAGGRNAVVSRFATARVSVRNTDAPRFTGSARRVQWRSTTSKGGKKRSNPSARASGGAGSGRP